jgi:hypothetical protein
VDEIEYPCDGLKFENKTKAIDVPKQLPFDEQLKSVPEPINRIIKGYLEKIKLGLSVQHNNKFEFTHKDTSYPEYWYLHISNLEQSRKVSALAVDVRREKWWK